MAVLRLNVTIDEDVYPCLFEALAGKGKQARCELLRALAWEGLRDRLDGAKSADRQQLLVTAVDSIENFGATTASSTARRDDRPVTAVLAPLLPATAPQPPFPVTGAGGAAQASPPAGRSASRSAARSLVKGGFVVG